MARSSACLDFLLLLFSSDSIAFPFYFFSFLPRLRGFVSPPDVHWRRNVCSRGGDVLSAVVGFIPHPRLKQRQKTCGRPDCRHKHKQKCNQEWRTENPDYFRGGLCAAKGKVRDALRLQAVATVSNIPTTCGATRFPSENGAS